MRFIFDGEIGGVVIAFLPLDIQVPSKTQSQGPLCALLHQAIQPTLPGDNERHLRGNQLPSQSGQNLHARTACSTPDWPVRAEKKVLADTGQ